MHHIIVDERPISWKRAGYHAAKGYVTAFDRQKIEKYHTRTLISRQFRREPIDGAVKIDIDFYLPIPASCTKKLRLACERNEVYHTKKPDIDNYLKYIFDCMSGVVFADDAQIYEIRARKLYAAEPRTEIYIFTGMDDENNN